MNGFVRFQYFSLLCVKYIFGFIKALDSKGISRTLKEVLHQPYKVLTLLVHFRYKTNNILLTLQVYFAEVLVINLFVI